MDFAAGAAAYLDVLRFVHISSWVKCRESLRRAQFAHGQKSVQGSPLSCRFALALFVWPCEVRARFSPYHARGSSATAARGLSHFGVFAFSFPTPPARVFGGPMPEVRDLLG